MTKPSGITTDSSGNIYVGIFNGSGGVYKVTPGGTVTTYVSGIAYATGLVFDSAGNLYVSSFDGFVAIVPPGGGSWTNFASVTSAYGITIDGSGNLYVSDLEDNVVDEITTPGGVVSTYATGGLLDPDGLIFDPSGKLYVANLASGKISVVPAGGGAGTTYYASGLGYPYGLAFDSSGTLYAASEQYGKIYKISSGGALTQLATGFSEPQGLAFFAPGLLYVADYSAGTLSVISVLPVPSISAVSPAAASINGGTALTITGTGFSGATQLTIGGQNIPSSSFTFNSSTTISFTAPAASPGVVDITVTGPGGTSSTSAADQITYEGAPTLTGLSQIAGPPAGGNVITLTGTNFVGASAVEVGGTSAGSFTVHSPTQIYYTVPAGSAGSDSLSVVTPGGTSAGVVADIYTYENAPTVLAISPAFSVIPGGGQATITGTNFTAASAVHFGGVTATSFTVNSPTVIFATVPAAAGSGLVDVTVTNPTGTSSAVATDKFSYSPPAPSFNGATAASATAGQSFSYQSAAFNATGYSAAGLPAGLTINASTGAISGTPTTAGTYAVVLTLTGPGGSSTGNLTISVAAAPLIAQTITFPALPSVPFGSAPITLSATASSGLPVTYAVSGAASLNGSILTLNSVGIVTVQASQAGNSTYAAALPVTQSFSVNIGFTLSFFGSFSGGATGSSTGGKLQPQAATTSIAATVNRSGTAGTLVGYIASLNAGFVTSFTVGSGGAFSTTTPTIVAAGASAQSLTISGTLTSSSITGSIAGLGLTFNLAVDPSSGPSSTLTGLYSASSTQSSAGGVYTIVGSQNDVFVLYASPSLISSGTGTVSNNSFTVQGTSSATITGSLNPSTTAITGSVSTPSSGTTTYTGLSSATAVAVRLINLSTRGVVAPSSALTAGFVITGPAQKTVLLRGVGPALATFGITGALAHPTLTLLSATGAVMATNTGWASSASLSTAFASAGAFSFPANSADSALVATLAPGKYTIQVSDNVADAGGVALAEIYDASIDLTGATQKLVNVSSLGQVGVGNTALIAGFIVSGNDTKQVLIRGAGPSLAAFGVGGLIADPVLNVYSAAGTLIAQNNDWGTPIQVGSLQTAATAAQLVAAAAQIGAFSLLSGSKDAAVLVTLAPGSYTAQVSNGASVAGTGLVEIYEVSP